MKKRYKRKIKKEVKAFLLIICIICLITMVFKKRKVESPKIIKENNYEITDSKESDSEIINTIFADGMDVNDYKKIFDFIPTKLEINGQYNKIDFDFDKLLHYEDVENYIKQMTKSNIVNTYIIGKTYDNRNIYNIEIGSGNKVLMLDANMHAAEAANTPILTKFLIDILNDYENNDKRVVELLKNVKIAAIPCINPDGYEVYNFGFESIRNKNLWIYQNKDSVSANHFKYNANGVDLNRNYPTQSAGLYHTDKKLISSVSLNKTTKRYTYFGGETLGSEPETRAVMYQMLTHYKTAYAYINIHSQGRVIYSGKPNLSDEYNQITIDLCKRMGKILNYKVHGLDREEVGEGNDGTASDFMAELVNGLVFSTKTGRLSTTRYKNNNVTLKYSVPAIVLETMNDNYKDPKKYKDEYYNHGIKKMFYDLLEYGYEQTQLNNQ